LPLPSLSTALNARLGSQSSPNNNLLYLGSYSSYK